MGKKDFQLDLIDFFFLLVLISLGFYFRIYHAPLGWFIHDSARDLRFAQAIARGQSYPLLGPTAGGIFYLGPFYYYLLSLPLFFTSKISGSYYFIACINALSVILVYFFVKKFFSSKLAIVSSLLYATFPFTILTGRNMWNPALLPTFSLLFFFCLFLWLKGRKMALPFSLFLFSLLTQIHAVTLVFFLILILAFFINKEAFSLKYFLMGILLAMLPYLPYFYYEFHHDFENAKAFFGFLTSNYQSHPRSPIALFFNATCLYPKMAKEFFLPTFCVFILYLETVLFLCALIFHIIKFCLKKISCYELFILNWLLLPIVFILTKKDRIWFYYFDVTYPAYFILLSNFILNVRLHFKKNFIPFVLVILLGCGHLFSAYYFDYNLAQKGYYQIRLAGLQDIINLNKGPRFILSTFKAKWDFWQKLSQIYPLTYTQTLTHLHGPGAWLMRDQDNRFIASLFAHQQTSIQNPPHLVINLKQDLKRVKLFSVGEIYVYKTEIPLCEHIPAHFSSLPSWDYFETPLYAWGKKNITLNCFNLERPLVVQTAISWKNQSAKISFFCHGQSVQAKEKLIHIAYVGPIRIFKINCPGSLSIRIENEHSLTLDIDAYF